MESRRTMDSTDGFVGTNWSRCHDGSPAIRTCAVVRVLDGRASDGGAERLRASRVERAHLPPFEKRGGKGTEGAASIHERATAGAGGIRFARRASLGPLPAGVLPIGGAGEVSGGRNRGAGEHEGDGVVLRFRSVSLGISTAGFKWPDRIRPVGPVIGRARKRPRCSECGR